MDKSDNFTGQQFYTQKRFIIILSILGLVLAASAVIWLNLPVRPDISGMSADSGFFAYFGRAILNGQIPYRDLFDNKPPIGYYLNALGLLIFGQNPWGIWWFGILWIFGCMVLFFIVLMKFAGRTAALIGSATFLLALMNRQIFEAGNMTEVFALAPQIGILGVSYLFFTRQHRLRFAVIAGVLTACAFLIKQPTIVLGCASVLIMFISYLSEMKISQAIKVGLGFSLGFFGLVSLALLYWVWKGALPQFLDGVFQGYFYIGGQGTALIPNFFRTLGQILPNLYISKLYLLALVAGFCFLIEKLYIFWIKPVLSERLKWYDWLLICVIILFPLMVKLINLPISTRRLLIIFIFLFALYILVKFYRLPAKPVNKLVFSSIEWVYLIAVLSLPLETLMASLGGRNFGHYFITMIPAIVIALAYPIWKVMTAIREPSKSISTLIWTGVYLVLAVGTLVWSARALVKDWPSVDYRNDLGAIFKRQVQLNDLEQYIVDTTKPTDTMLVWHIHLGINFETNRQAASRYLFPLILFIPPNDQNTRLTEYIDELENQPPELIVVQQDSSISLPFVDTPVDQLCKNFCTPEFEQAIKVPEIYQEWLRLQQFFDTHYTFDKKIYDWNVYRKLP